jgi:RsiW-degrading membrane proteinase PrsW (M82 family)
LFSDVFRRHGVDELENLLAVGAPRTTPPLDPSMANFPNPWIFFRAFAVSLLAYGAFYYGLVKFGNVKLLPGFIMIGSFAVPLSVLVLFFEMNTPRNVSAPRVIQFLVVGGSASLLLSLFLYDLSSLSSMFGASAAGVVEECGKLAAVALTLRMAPRGRYPWRLNALLFGAAVGTGFAAFESAGYALERALSGGDMLGNIAVRGFLSPFGHIVWTAIAAAALWGAQREGGLLSLQFLRLFAIPVALHFIWNLDFDLPFFGKELILGFIAWVVVISLVQTGLKEIAVAATPTGATQGVNAAQ